VRALVVVLFSGCGGPGFSTELDAGGIDAGTPFEDAGAPPSLLDQVDAFLQANEVDGVTRDARSLENPTEEIRLTVAPQLLGYVARYEAGAAPLEDVSSRADFLVQHFDEAVSGGPFDGMLAYALLAAWEHTKDEATLARADELVDACLALPDADTVLNGGLMCAMGLAKHAALFADAASIDRTDRILGQLDGYVHPDGSFPHWCPGTTDVHYSAWMGMELALIDDEIDSAAAREKRDGIASFLEARVGETGEPTYEDDAGVYWSLGSGCGTDYDTRGWVNELGYEALVLDRTGSAEAAASMSFLTSLARDGGFADKWAYPVPESDPIYPWATGDPSIIRTSVVFWSLAVMGQ